MTRISLLKYGDSGWTCIVFTPHFLPFQALLPRDLGLGRRCPLFKFYKALRFHESPLYVDRHW